MTAIKSHLRRINQAESLDALIDIARDIEALMAMEHAPAGERAAVEAAVEKRVKALGAMLMAG
jgi:hypothetical protein